MCFSSDFPLYFPSTFYEIIFPLNAKDLVVDRDDHVINFIYSGDVHTAA